MYIWMYVHTHVGMYACTVCMYVCMYKVPIPDKTLPNILYHGEFGVVPLVLLLLLLLLLLLYSLVC